MVSDRNFFDCAKMHKSGDIIPNLMNWSNYSFTIAIMLSTGLFFGIKRSAPFIRKFTNIVSLSTLVVGDHVPEGIIVDILKSTDDKACSVNEAQDFGAVLKSSKKVVVFAVPGAFTPTCSAQHLPGFVALAESIRAKGVDEIYCLSVNDRFVMRAWADATPGFAASGIKMVADGNGDYATALGLSKDTRGIRFGAVRAKRFAAVVEQGKVTLLNVDDTGLTLTSAEAVLKAL